MLRLLESRLWFYLIGAVFVALFYLSQKGLKLRAKIPKKPQRTSNDKRRKGEWTPELFQTPVPPPYPNWDIHKTKPLPYRAFRHKYNITMGIRNMEWDSWIELDNEWQKSHDQKLGRLQERGTELFGTKPQAADAVMELLEEFWSYLPHRYPTLFKQTPKGLYNLHTGEDFVFRNCKADELAEEPIVMAAKMIQDDLAIMMEAPNGEYHLQAGAIILPGFWRFKDKFGLSLNEIHTSGDVPQYRQKLQTGMNKFFSRLTCDKPVVRNNYFIQLDNELGWSKSIGDEDSDRVGWYTAGEAISPEQLYFRSERQSLRRLPRSGAVVFTIRTYFAPIVEICQEPYIPRRLLNGIESWSDDVREYRGYDKFKDAILPYLAQEAEKQEEKGYIVDTEPSVYPF